MQLHILLSCLAFAQISSAWRQTTAKGPIPVVLYHGMGDTAYSNGMKTVISEIEQLFPGIFVHSIQIGKDADEDRSFTYYDNINRQIDEVCEQLQNIPELAGGFNAIGFSQGGQFLRAYVERCNDPPVHNLITIGSQHQGIMDMPGCDGSKEKPTQLFKRLRGMFGDFDLYKPSEESGETNDCSWWKKLLKYGVYNSWVHDKIVQAQYFKDPYRMDAYMDVDTFLSDINNERDVKNDSYRSNMLKLNKFVMYMFGNDTQMVPKESAIFGFFDGTVLKDMREQPIYTEDWIGLKTLDERNALHFGSIAADHMVIPRNFISQELHRWLQ